VSATPKMPEGHAGKACKKTAGSKTPHGGGSGITKNWGGGETPSAVRVTNPVGPNPFLSFSKEKRRKSFDGKRKKKRNSFGIRQAVSLKMQHKSPKLTVDAVILNGDSIVLVKRKNPPFQGMWALPGGFVEYGETVEEAVNREAKEETGLHVWVEKLIGVYSDPDRDPRGHTVSVVFFCKPLSSELRADSDAKEARYFNLSNLPQLAFDHIKVVGDALKLIKG